MNDVLVDRFRIHTADGRRLASVAARMLPAALDLALADLEDADLGRLAVRLDLDPADYDDHTLAVLWADRIRHAAIAAGARPRPGARPPSGRQHVPGSARSSGRLEAPEAPADDGARATTLVASTVSLAAGARAWLDAGTERTRAVPVVLAGLAERERAAEVASVLGTETTERLGLALTQAAVDPWSTDSAPPIETSPVESNDRSSTTTARPPATTSDAPGVGDLRRSTADRLARAARDVQSVLALVADVEGPSASADLTGVTRFAGLVLLYPWLAGLCGEAEALHPGLDPEAVRRFALARLADPSGASETAGIGDVADDPLVLLLAGCPQGAPTGGRLVSLDHGDRIAESADGILASFVALLPGFERSSPGFVRDAWVTRPGALDTGRDPVQLLAATSPLDVVLPLLPYPVGLIRLPWTPPIAVRFRP